MHGAVWIEVSSGDSPNVVDGCWLGYEIRCRARDGEEVARGVAPESFFAADSVVVEPDDDSAVIHSERLREAAVGIVEGGYSS